MLVPERSVQALLTGAAATYYTAPVNTRAIVKKVTFANTTNVARTVTAYMVPSGGAAAASNQILNVVVIPPNSTVEAFVMEGHNMRTGDFIQALSDLTTVIAVLISVLELTQ